MLIYYVYCVYLGLPRLMKKQQQQLRKKKTPLCINYNNPHIKRKGGKKIHAEIKAEWPGVIMCQKIRKTQLPDPLQ